MYSEVSWTSNEKRDTHSFYAFLELYFIILALKLAYCRLKICLTHSNFLFFHHNLFLHSLFLSKYSHISFPGLLQIHDLFSRIVMISTYVYRYVFINITYSIWIMLPVCMFLWLTVTGQKKNVFFPGEGHFSNSQLFLLSCSQFFV